MLGARILTKFIRPHRQQSPDLCSGRHRQESTWEAEQREVSQSLTVSLHVKGDQSEQQQRTLAPQAALQPSSLHWHGTVCRCSPLFCLTSVFSPGQDPHASFSLPECVCVCVDEGKRASEEKRESAGGGWGVGGERRACEP